MLWLVARGSTDAAIARELAVAPRTVQGDVAALKAIHGVTSRAALVAAAAPITGSLGGLTPRQHAVVEIEESLAHLPTPAALERLLTAGSWG